MIFETIMMLLPGVLGSYMIVKTATDSGKRERQLENLVESKSIVLEPTEEISPTIEIVLELLRSNDEWELTHTKASKSSRGNCYTHETGVKVENYILSSPPYNTPITRIYIQDEKGEWIQQVLNSLETGKICEELKAYNARATDRRKRELARMFAERVIARENGMLQPLLGGPGVSSESSTSENDSPSISAITTGLLSYNETTKQITASMRGDNVRLNLDANLDRRYRELIGRSDFDRIIYQGYAA
jgi:hypothetical protein